VGKSFLEQLQWLSEQRRPSLELTLSYIATSNKAFYNAEYSLGIENALEELAASTQTPFDLPKLAKHLAASPDKVILVDNTGTGVVANAYPMFLKHGISIVTPSKKAFAGPYQLWQDIFAAAASSGAVPYLEASVGAGLPLISTLKDLVYGGDEIYKIEGALSGTLGYLFSSFAPIEGAGQKWSAAVERAKDLGFTEPDPREDLNGLDVARKLIIFARLAGLPIESTTSFPIHTMVPKELESLATSDEFLQRLPEFDERMEEMKRAAEDQGKVLRYVGKIDMTTKRVEVGPEAFDKSHPVAVLKGSDNMISFYTKRYPNTPLIVQGAGAGAEVTAMGIIGGIYKVAERIA
jgi:homoserine dehydrogenase